MPCTLQGLLLEFPRGVIQVCRISRDGFHICNHQEGFVKQKIVVLHRYGFNLKFPKHCYSTVTATLGKHHRCFKIKM